MGRMKQQERESGEDQRMATTGTICANVQSNM